MRENASSVILKIFLLIYLAMHSKVLTNVTNWYNSSCPQIYSKSKNIFKIGNHVEIT